MILNSERDALIKDLIMRMEDFAHEERDEAAQDLAKCLSYMHKLWKDEVKVHFYNGGRECFKH